MGCWLTSVVIAHRATGMACLFNAALHCPGQWLVSGWPHEACIMGPDEMVTKMLAPCMVAIAAVMIIVDAQPKQLMMRWLDCNATWGQL